MICLIEQNKIITNEDVQVLLETTKGCANVLLSEMTKSGKIKRISRGKYVLNNI